MTRIHLATAIMGLALLAAACIGPGAPGGADTGARWSDTPNQALLNRLPAFAGATLVREWEVTQANEDIHVRQYALATPPEQAASQVVLFYREWLLQNGWTEAQPRAAFAPFSKAQDRGNSRLIIGLVGPQLMETPASARSLQHLAPPAGATFYYTLEMTADWRGSPPR